MVRLTADPSATCVPAPGLLFHLSEEVAVGLTGLLADGEAGGRQNRGGLLQGVAHGVRHGGRGEDYRQAAADTQRHLNRLGRSVHVVGNKTWIGTDNGPLWPESPRRPAGS